MTSDSAPRGRPLIGAGSGNSPLGEMTLPRGLSQCGRPERDQTCLR